MRHIDNRQIELPDGWKEKAKAAKEGVASGAHDINSRSLIWQELKGALAKLSHEKCWYCECKQERSDDAVDHFRPKNRISECEGHSGYTWLAFEESNYRYSCTFCNSRRKGVNGNVGGKADSFPLLDESKRAIAPGGEDDERPKTLDPCKAGEPAMLDWLEDGTPRAKYSNHQIQKMKAESAIVLYHLDHPRANECRRSIAIDISTWARSANRHYLKFSDPDCEESETEWCERCQDICKAIREDAPYSAFAKRMLTTLRPDYPWLEDILQTA